MTQGTLLINWNGVDYYLSQSDIATAVGGTCRLMNYTPQWGGDDAQTVYEEAIVEISGTSGGVIGTAINRLNRLLQSGRDQVNDTSQPIAWLQFRPDGYDSAYHSPLLGGKIIHVEDKTFNTGFWGSNFVHVTIGWERSNYWESLNAISIKYSNSNVGTAYDGSNSAGTIFNSGGMVGAAPNKLDNSMIIRPDDLSGDLPSPIIAYIGNLGTNPADTINKIYIGNYYSSFTSFGTSNYTLSLSTKFLEGETSSLGGSVGTAVALASSCSGSAYISGTLTSASEASLFQWAIPTTSVNVFLKGDVFNVMARFADTTSLTNTKFRWKILSGNTTVWSGPQFQLNVGSELIQNMGAMNIPPTALNYWTGTMSMQLTGQPVTGSSGTINLDFIQLFGHNFAQLSAVRPIGTSEKVWFGEIPYRRTAIHSVDPSNKSLMDWTYRGANAVYVDPRYTNVIFMLYQGSAGTYAPVNGTISANTWVYYPRRRTL